MERETAYLLHLLGAYLREEEPESCLDADWNRLSRLAGIHHLSGILGYMAMNHPICPDAQMQEALRNRCLNTIMRYAGRGALAEEFSEILSQNGIDHIVMKGFVLKELYPVPELRTYGDVDLVIRREDREKCHDLMKKLGFSVKADWEPVYGYTRNREFYELHTELLDTDLPGKANCRDYFRTPWAHARCEEHRRFQFEPEYHFLYLVTHLAKHVAGSGAGLRMYLDIAVFVQRYGDTLNWGKTGEALELLGLDRFAGTVLSLVEQAFGISAPIGGNTVGQTTIDEFLEFTLNGGVFGKVDKEGGVLSMKEESRNRGEISRSGTLVSRLFPAAKTIQSRYTYLQKSPWLLPVAWVHRAVKTSGKLRDHAAEARSILSADKDAVRQLNRLYEEIGL